MSSLKQEGFFLPTQNPRLGIASVTMGYLWLAIAFGIALAPYWKPSLNVYFWTELIGIPNVYASSLGLLANVPMVLIITLILGLPARWFLDFGRRHQSKSFKDATSQLTAKGGEYVLYLRPFDQDGGSPVLPIFRNGWNPFSPHSWKIVWLWITGRSSYLQIIESGLRSYGECIVIGQPNEKLPRLGAVREYLPAERWHTRVDELMSNASLVVLQIGLSDGVIWEVKKAISNVDPGKLLLSVPLTATPGRFVFFKERMRQKTYREFVQRTARIFSVPLPTRLAGCQFIGFAKDWTPACIVKPPPKVPLLIGFYAHPTPKKVWVAEDDLVGLTDNIDWLLGALQNKKYWDELQDNVYRAMRIVPVPLIVFSAFSFKYSGPETGYSALISSGAVFVLVYGIFVVMLSAIAGLVSTSIPNALWPKCFDGLDTDEGNR